MTNASNVDDGIHTVPTNNGWENQQNGIVLSRHQKKAKAVASGRSEGGSLGFAMLSATSK